MIFTALPFVIMVIVNAICFRPGSNVAFCMCRMQFVSDSTELQKFDACLKCRILKMSNSIRHVSNVEFCMR